MSNPLEALLQELESSLTDAGVAAGSVTLVMVLLVLLVTFAVCLLIYSIPYIIQSIALMNMAKKVKACPAILAWIPIVQYYVLGAIVEKCDERRGIAPKRWKMIVLWANLGALLFFVVDYFAAVLLIFTIVGIPLAYLLIFLIPLVSLALQVLMFFCYWKIFREFYPSPANVIVFAVDVASCIIPLLSTFSAAIIMISLFVASFFKPQPAVSEEIEAEVIYD